jgi:hypothetical protein
MIHMPASVRVCLCLTPCDMRKSCNGLHALVREHLELDPFAGHLFVFASRREVAPQTYASLDHRNRRESGPLHVGTQVRRARGWPRPQAGGCGHEAVPHGDQVYYLVSGHLHHPHNEHCDDHGKLHAAD